MTSSRLVQKTEKRWDETTKSYYDLAVEEVQETYRVSQSQTLKKMIDLLSLDENAAILDKVDAIHFIVTKADTLAVEKDDRLSSAKDHFDANYSQLLAPLRTISEQHSHVNRATDGRPKLYSFSLGKFYPGGIFDYDSADSEKISTVIACNSRREVNNTSFWGKLKRRVNMR